jgi:hypothetical protein
MKNENGIESATPSHLDPSHQILKSTIKDILDENQGVNQLCLRKLFTPLNLVSNILANKSESMNRI